jgi:hypothetical protein
MPTLDLQVGASTDDCLVYWDGSAWGILTAGLKEPQAGWHGTAWQKMGGGMRFTGVNIPKGATINTAYLIITCGYASSVATVNSRIRAERASSPATFSTYADYNGRTRTTAYVAWDNIGAWAKDSQYQSPEIKAVIQEVADNYDINDLVIFWDDHDDRSSHDTNCRRVSYSYDDGTTLCAKLHVEYTAVTEKTSSDTGAGADAYVSLETPEAKSSSDIGSGFEVTPVPSASLTGSESGAGIEALAARLLVSFDTGGGVEAAQLMGQLKELFATELGEGLDSLVAKIEMPTKGGGMKLWT